MKKTFLAIAVILGIGIIISCNKSGSKVELKTSTDTISYCWGVKLGQALKSQGYESVNNDIMVRATEDILGSKELVINSEKVDELIQKYGTEARKQMLERNKKKSEDFLAENKKKAGVITTASGLQYEVVTQGSGPVPKANDNVTVNYHGTLIDGTVFDSSVERKKPAQFQIGTGRVIPAWDEALLMMPVGSKWKLYVPPALGYGENPRRGGKIEPNDLLIFEVELISIDPPTAEEGQQQQSPVIQPQNTPQKGQPQAAPVQQAPKKK